MSEETSAVRAHSFATALVIVGVFVPPVVGGVYQGSARVLPVQVAGLFDTFQFVGVAIWFWSYCHARRIAWAMDMGLLMVAWPLVVPYYLLSREGRRGLRTIALFVAMSIGAWAMGWATSIWISLLFGTE